MNSKDKVLLMKFANYSNKTSLKLAINPFISNKKIKFIKNIVDV